MENHVLHVQWLHEIQVSWRKAAMIIDHTHERFKRMLVIRTKHNTANLGGNPLYEATKQYLMVKWWKTAKNEM